jgi:ribosomal protein S18 acetylase RimI-like enzyme
MGGIEIREATAEDLASILNLYRTAGIGEANFSVEEARAQFAALKRYPSFRVFVAIVGGAIVGTYELLVMDNLAKRGARSGVVEDVAVDPQFQGQGIGRAMMQHALEQCRQAHCYKLTLSSNIRREEAHRFYEALGFEKHGYSFRIEMESL